jgi:hypothetical protein
MQSRKPKGVHPRSAGGKFGRYKDISERASREARVGESPGAARLVRHWERFCRIAHAIRGWDGADISPGAFHYNLALGYLGGIDIRPRQIEAFSVALSASADMERFGIPGGIHLSAPINTGRSGNYSLWTSGYISQLESLGHRNRKSIVVHGDAGHYSFEGMESGEVLVEGEVTDSAGENMSGGVLRMGGALLIEHAIAGFEAGPVSGGKIYHKGALMAGEE